MVVIIIFCLIMQIDTSFASKVQWTTNGVVVCTFGGDQKHPKIVSDNFWGAIITWYDNRRGNYDVYAQRINSVSKVQWWATDGVPICTVAGDQVAPSIINDGMGGVIVTWTDWRNGNMDVYAQRISVTGYGHWIPVSGVVISTAVNQQWSPEIVTDGAGGGIIVWTDYRSGTNRDVYAQRINYAGRTQWTANGVAICTASGNQEYPEIISDGFGGAIITWQDHRGTYFDIYAQRINPTGEVQWTANGVKICTAVRAQTRPTIISDGSGGAIIAWQDRRSGTDWDIYAQRINSAGKVQWTAEGVAICIATGNQEYPEIISDGSGGAIITWQDWRNGNWDIYAQRVSSAGVVQWTVNGVAVCTAAGNQDYPQIISDGSGGAIITWQDWRNGNCDIYAHRISSAGVVQWTVNGVAICTADGTQNYPQIISDDSGGAIITWQDFRGGTNYDIYAQRIGFPKPILFHGVAISTNSIKWSWEDNSNTETGYRVYSSTGGIVKDGLPVNTTYWLETNLLPNTQYTRYAVAYDTSGESFPSNLWSKYTLANPPTGLRSVVVYVTSATIRWDDVGATRYGIERSIGIDSPDDWKMITWIKETEYTDIDLYDDTTYWYRVKSYNGDGVINNESSDIIKIITVDIPPSTPLIWIFSQSGDNQIKPGDTIVYIGAAAKGGSAFHSIKIKDQNDNILTTGIDTTGVTIDSYGNISGNISIGNITKNYPLVTSIKVEIVVKDKRGNLSPIGVSNILEIAPFTKPKFYVYNNLFNPLNNERVNIRYELPEETDVKITVYDIYSGREIKKLFEGRKPAGIHIDSSWDGKNFDDHVVASGIYIIYIQAGNFKDKKKIIVVK